MEFALSENKVRITATPPTKGYCPLCHELMVPKCGDIKMHHWAHKSKINCDSWWEPESEWHRQWKDLFPEEFREIIIEKEGKKHIADIQLLSKIVIEFQKSRLPHDERIEREQFYQNMIWVLHFSKEKIIEIDERRRYTKRFDDLYIEANSFPEAFSYPPHFCPIFLDFNDGEMFWVKEFDSYDFGREKGIYGKIISLIEFEDYILKMSVSDLEKLKLSHYYRDCEAKQREAYAENRSRREEKWQKERDEKRKIIEADKNLKNYCESPEEVNAFFEKERRYLQSYK